MATDSAICDAPPTFAMADLKLRKSPVWHATAPKSVRNAYDSGREEDGWTAWLAHLAARKKPAMPKVLAAGKRDPQRSPLWWAMPAAVNRDRIDALLAVVGAYGCKDKGRDKYLVDELESWLSATDRPTPNAQFALEALALAYQLPQFAERLPAGLWWQLVDRLVEIANDATALDLSQEPLPHQLLAGELALVLGYLLPELGKCRALVKPSRKALSSGLVETLDGQGLPHASNLPEFRPLLACWTRCAAIGEHLKRGAWKNAAAIQYGWSVRQALRLARHDGSQVFDAAHRANDARELFAAALDLAGDRADRAIAIENLPRRWTKHLATNKQVSKIADPSLNSSWADLSTLRCDWTRQSPSLVVSYAADTFAAELANQSQVLSSGVWQTEISYDGQSLAPDGAWSELCTVTDEDVDYLELQMPWTGGVTMQRQMLLARKDRFLFVADALLCENAGKWEYRQVLPLAKGVVLAGEEETREGYLKHDHRPLGMVIPPALPEWRADRRGGSLGLSLNGLEMRLSANGAAMYAPLFIDLKPGRMTREKTWRKLTVAALLEVQSPEVAVGYRIQLANKQWLVYRSLAEAANRTILSHNLTCEFLVARFRRDGQIETLLEIEP